MTFGWPWRDPRAVIRIAVPLAILVGMIALYVSRPVLVARAQRVVFDSYQRIVPRPFDARGAVRIVDVDDESLARLGQWPWPRTRVAELVDRLAAMGAAVIAFDIAFAEPDRTSPARAVRDWRLPGAESRLREEIARLPDHDAVLAQAIARFGRAITGFVLTQSGAGRAPRQGGSFAFGGDDPHRFVPVFTGAVSTLAELEIAAAGNGSFNMIPDFDGLIRKVPLVMGMHPGEPGPDAAPPGTERLYASLAMEALRVAQGARTYKINSSGASGLISFGETTGIVEIQVGSARVPTDVNGAIWMYYSGHRAERFIPAWKALDGSVDPAEIEGRIVLIGTSAAGLLDLRATPRNLVVPGVEVHAEAIEQILEGLFISRPDWAPGAETLLLFVLGMALALLIPVVGAVGCAVLGVVAVAAACGVSWYAFSRHLVLFDPIYPSVSALLVYLAGSLLNYLQSETERRQVRHAFKQYMSPALVEELARHPERLKLGGDTREMTILFCDVRGFTALSENFKTEPQALVRLINRLLTPLTDAILARGGTIDKYMGDAIMAFWNAPLDVPDHATRAIDAGLAMLGAMAGLNEARRAEAAQASEKFHRLSIGIGLNTGTVVVGNMGSQQRFDYSVIGDAVNLASRLEGQSKAYGVNLVIGPDTRAQAGDGFAFVELDLIAVQGKAEASRIFTTLGGPERAREGDFAAFRAAHDQFLRHYRAQAWDAAEAALSALKGRMGGALDGYYGVFAARIAGYRAAPPGADWDGVYRATTK